VGRVRREGRIVSFISLATLTALLLCAAPALAEQLSPQVEAARPVIAGKVIATHDSLPTDRYPFHTHGGTSWTTVEPKSWIAGFLPGSLWYEYQRTGWGQWRSAATQRLGPLEFNKNATTNHDIGFILLNSYRNGHRLTDDPAYRDVLVQGASSLSTRYDPLIGMVRTRNTDRDFWVYNDTMMNIELLYWGARNGGDPAWRGMATSHALRTITDFLRPDGSSYHYVAYSESTGKVVDKGQGQGYAKESTWSRGQAWIIYGLAMAYRETGDARLLAGAHRASDYWRSNVPTDLVPYWDFDAPGIPNEPLDSSAAAIAAAAFVELGTLDPDPARRIEYLQMARDTLESLTSPAYLSTDPAFPAVLMHGTYAETINSSDHGLSWGDYYLAEAIARLRTEVVRYAAPDRFSTAVRVSQLEFESADTVVIVNGMVFSDALSASSLAGLYDAPVLLTTPGKLPYSVVAEIERLGATKAYIVGGPASVSWSVQHALNDMPGVSVTRISGDDRFEVSANVAQHLDVVRDPLYDGRVFVVSGEVFPDALSVSPTSYDHGIPVLLTPAGKLPHAVRDVLEDPDVIGTVIVGGPASVSWSVQREVSDIGGMTIERVYGPDRYTTAIEFADWAMVHGMSSSGYVGTAVGDDFPDALMGGAAVGSNGGVLLLTDGRRVSSAVDAFLRSESTTSTQVRVFGGEQRVTAFVENSLRNALPEQ
jgi:putative cell wall-binding protein